MPELNKHEKDWLWANPGSVLAVYQTAMQALETTEKEFPNSADRNSGPGDAFRHVYWSALLCQRIGINKARQFLQLHEKDNYQPGVSNKMDLENNEIGLRIGHEKPDDSELLIRIATHAALQSRELKILRRHKEFFDKLDKYQDMAIRRNEKSRTA